MSTNSSKRIKASTYRSSICRNIKKKMISSNNKQIEYKL